MTIGFSSLTARLQSLAALSATLLGLAATSAFASPVAVGVGAFSGDTLESYNYGYQAINGQTYSTVLHNYSINGLPSSQAVIQGAGTLSGIYGYGNPEVLSFTFGSLVTRMGFDWQIDIYGASIANAMTIELFDASNTSLGALSFNGAPYPGWTGAFSGIEELSGFKRADVWFNNGSQFAVDNLRFGGAPVPEPGMLGLMGVGLAALAATRRRKQMAV